MMQNLMDSFLFWLTHSPWPCPTIALLIFLESSPLIGLLIPGIILVPAIGTISGHGLLDFWQIFFCAATGAFVIDSIGYWLGRKGYTQWQHRFAHKRTEALQNRTRQLFHRYGPIALFAGRILFVVHPMVPMMAGMLGVRILTFYLIDSIAIVSWLLIYLGGGHWLAVLWQQISSTQQLLLLGFSIFALLLWLLHKKTKHQP
jgi:undecaprenyl-diphosphatase